MHRTRTMARRSKASSEVTDDGRAAHLRNWFFISAPAPSPHVDVPTSPFSIAPPAASAPVAERPVLHWLRADDDVQVATLRSEEHTSELQSRGHLVCRLLLENTRPIFMLFCSLHSLPHLSPPFPYTTLFRSAHLRNWFFISAPAPSPHVDVPTSPFSIAPPAASAPVAERPVLHWLRADDDVQVATLAGEFAGHVVSDLTTHSAYGPHAVRLGDYLSLIAAKSALKAALAPRIEGEDRLGRRLSRSATDPQRRRRNGYPSHTRGLRQRRNIAMATGIVTWFNSDKGYGFIAPKVASADVCAHFSAIAGTGRRDLEENQRFVYDAEQGPKGLQATYIRSR